MNREAVRAKSHIAYSKDTGCLVLSPAPSANYHGGALSAGPDGSGQSPLVASCCSRLNEAVQQLATFAVWS